MSAEMQAYAKMFDRQLFMQIMWTPTQSSPMETKLISQNGE